MDFFTGNIVLFSGTRLPSGWLPCDGQLLQINAYPALYSLIGNAYGGNMGNGTFALPKLAPPASGPMHYLICVDGAYPAS